MEERFTKFIQERALLSGEDRVLLAVSGGVDSVVLCHLCHCAGLDFGIAHCNFQLRGSESDEDARFVEQLAEALDVPCYSIAFDTLGLAQERKASIQVLARNLRYDWLYKLQERMGYNCIATAHHLNDAIETFLYNFTKGTGIRGLQGIPLRNESVIRPLLFASKADIMAYAKQEKLAYREDSSNTSDKYARNKIRQKVIPTLRELNPSLEQTSQQTFRNLNASAELYHFAIKQIQSVIMQALEQEVTIHWEQLLEFPVPETVLLESIRDFGFNADQVQQILEAPAGKTGALFYSKTHRLLIDRHLLRIQELALATEASTFYLKEGQAVLQLNQFRLEAKWRVAPPKKYPRDNNYAFLDMNKLHFPLSLRKWKPGDYFHPLGMQGKRQKLQDFFGNLKLSRFEKEQVWLLQTANEEICWVVGYRIDERFKLEETSKDCLELQYKF